MKLERFSRVSLPSLHIRRNDVQMRTIAGGPTHHGNVARMELLAGLKNQTLSSPVPVRACQSAALQLQLQRCLNTSVPHCIRRCQTQLYATIYKRRTIAIEPTHGHDHVYQMELSAGLNN